MKRNLYGIQKVYIQSVGIEQTFTKFIEIFILQE